MNGVAKGRSFSVRDDRAMIRAGGDARTLSGRIAAGVTWAADASNDRYRSRTAIMASDRSDPGGPTFTTDRTSSAETSRDTVATTHGRTTMDMSAAARSICARPTERGVKISKNINADTGTTIMGTTVIPHTRTTTDMSEAARSICAMPNERRGKIGKNMNADTGTTMIMRTTVIPRTRLTFIHLMFTGYGRDGTMCSETSSLTHSVSTPAMLDAMCVGRSPLDNRIIGRTTSETVTP